MADDRTDGLDPAALEAAAQVVSGYLVGEGSATTSNGIATDVLAAYFGALAPLQIEMLHGGSWTRWYGPRARAHDFARFHAKHIDGVRGLYPGPIREATDDG